MSSRKNEMIYWGIICLSVLLIYGTFKTAFSHVTMAAEVKNAEVFFLSFDSYVYLVAGLLLLSFTAYMYTHLTAYIAGKVFGIYLIFVCVSFCLAATTNYQYPIANTLISISVLLSNIFLFYSIGYITLLTHKKIFRYMAYLLLFITVLCAGIYVIGLQSNNILLVILKEDVIYGNYIFTVFITIIHLLYGYRGSTIYQKKQIRFLSSGLLTGVFIFIAMRFMPMLAIIKVPENAIDTSVSYQSNMIGSQQDFYPIMIFTGIAIAMIFVLIQREHLVFDENKDLRRYVLSSIYLIVGNTYLLFLTSINFTKFMLFNLIITAPLLFYNHRVWKRDKNVYNHNLIEVLEEERQRLAILLHDEILQDLISLSRMAKTEVGQEQFSAIIDGVRNISQELYPTIVEDLGLEQALGIFIEDIRADYNIDFIYKYEYPQGFLPQGIALVIYRSVKELVINAVKHAGCRCISVLITSSVEDIRCVVTDDGTGFQLPENIDLLKSPHMGLYTVRKQVVSLNGNMRILSDELGSKFQILIPVRC